MSEAIPDLPLLKRILEGYRTEGIRAAFFNDLATGQTRLMNPLELHASFMNVDRVVSSGVIRLDLYVAFHAPIHSAPELSTKLAPKHFLGHPIGLAPQAMAHWRSS